MHLVWRVTRACLLALLLAIGLTLAAVVAAVEWGSRSESAAAWIEGELNGALPGAFELDDVAVSVGGEVSIGRLEAREPSAGRWREEPGGLRAHVHWWRLLSAGRLEISGVRIARASATPTEIASAFARGTSSAAGDPGDALPVDITVDRLRRVELSGLLAGSPVVVENLERGQVTVRSGHVQVDVAELAARVDSAAVAARGHGVRYAIDSRRVAKLGLAELRVAREQSFVVLRGEAERFWQPDEAVGEISVSGELALADAMALGIGSARGRLRLDARAHRQHSGQPAHIELDMARVGRAQLFGYEVSGARARAQYDRGLIIDDLRVEGPGYALGVDAHLSSTSVRGSASLRGFPLAPLLAPTPASEASRILAAATMNANADGVVWSFADNRGRADIDLEVVGLGASSWDLPDAARVAAAVAFDGETVEIRDARLESDLVSATASGQVPVDGLLRARARARAALTTQRGWRPSVWPVRVASASLEVSVENQRVEGALATGAVELSNRPPVDVSLAFALDPSGAEVSELTMRGAGLRGRAEVSAAGDLLERPGEARVSCSADLAVTDFAPWGLPPVADSVPLARGGARLTVSGRGDAATRELRATVDLSPSPRLELAGVPVAGLGIEVRTDARSWVLERLSARALAGGTLDATAELVEQAGGDVFAAVARATEDLRFEARVQAEGVPVELGAPHLPDLEGALGTVSLSAEAEGSAAAAGMSARLSLAGIEVAGVRVGGSKVELELTRGGDEVEGDGRFSFANAGYADLTASGAGTLTVSRRDGPWTAGVGLASLRLGTPEHELALESPVDVRLSADRVLVPRFVLAGAGARFEGKAAWRRGEAPVARLAGQVPVTSFVPFVEALTGGTGALDVDVEIDGSRVAGTVQPQDGASLTLRGLDRELRLEGGRVELDDQRVVSRALRVGYAEGSWEMNGHLDVGPSGPRDWSLSARGDNIFVESGGFVLETQVDLELTGAGRWPAVGGAITVSHARYTRELTLSDFSLVRGEPSPSVPLGERLPQLADVRLDVDLSTAAPVELGFAAGPVGADLSMRADLRLVGTPLLPRVDGSVEVVGGELRFPVARLEVQSGSVSFSRTQPIDRARVELRAEGAVTTDFAGGPSSYWVTLGVDGAGDEIGVTLESDPALNRVDVASLLLRGAPVRAAGDEGGGLATDTAVAFAASQLASPLTDFLADQVGQMIRTDIDLSAEVTTESAGLELRKSFGERVVFTGGYDFAFDTGFGASDFTARFLITDGLFIDSGGRAEFGPSDELGESEADLTGRIELKLRVFGQ